MSALAAEIAGSFARCFALLGDLRALAPAEHAEIVRRCIAQIAAVTRQEQATRADSTPQKLTEGT